MKTRPSSERGQVGPSAVGQRVVGDAVVVEHVEHRVLGIVSEIPAVGVRVVDQLIQGESAGLAEDLRDGFAEVGLGQGQLVEEVIGVGRHGVRRHGVRVEATGDYRVTRRILSSFLPGSIRPSVFDVVIHSEPSGATTALRIRPWSSAK